VFPPPPRCHLLYIQSIWIQAISLFQDLVREPVFANSIRKLWNYECFMPVYFDQSQCSCGHLLPMQNMLKVNVCFEKLSSFPTSTRTFTLWFITTQSKLSTHSLGAEQCKACNKSREDCVIEIIAIFILKFIRLDFEAFLI